MSRMNYSELSLSYDFNNNSFKLIRPVSHFENRILCEDIKDFNVAKGLIRMYVNGYNAAIREKTRKEHQDE